MELFDTSPYAHLPLVTLRPENLKFLDSMLKEFSFAPLRYLGLTHINMEEYRPRMSEAIHTPNFKLWLKVKHDYQVDQQILKKYRWWQKKIKALQQPEHWQHILSQIPNAAIASVNDLHRAWLSEGNFALYSNSAILRVLNTVLPALGFFVRVARRDLTLSARTLEPSLRDHYTQYLDQLESRINNVKSQVITTLQARLERMTTHGIMHNHLVVYELAEALKKQIPSEFPTIIPNLHVAHYSEDIPEFVNYLLKEGSEASQQQLLQLPWLRSNEHFDVSCVDHRIRIIPKLFTGHSVIGTYKPKGLFQQFLPWRRQAKAALDKLIDDNTDLFIHLQILQGLPQDSTHPEQLKSIRETSKLCSDKLQKLYVDSLQSEKSPFKRWFKPGRHVLMKHWQGFLKQASLSVLKRQIDTLEQAVTSRQERLQEPECASLYSLVVNDYSQVESIAGEDAQSLSPRVAKLIKLQTHSGSGITKPSLPQASTSSVPESSVCVARSAQTESLSMNLGCNAQEPLKAHYQQLSEQAIAGKILSEAEIAWMNNVYLIYSCRTNSSLPPLGPPPTQPASHSIINTIN
jgi:hypothetical protein